MSYIDYKRFLKDRGIPRTDVEDGEVTLTKADAIKALDLLSDTDFGVLGGDVYQLESDGYFQPTHDNWFCNRGADDQITFAKKSRKIAREYLSNYKETPCYNIRYVLVIDER